MGGSDEPRELQNVLEELVITSIRGSYMGYERFGRYDKFLFLAI